MRMLAAISSHDATYDVPEYLPGALTELGLPSVDLSTHVGQEVAARAIARRLLAGKMQPRDLVSRIPWLLGSDLPFVIELAPLECKYETLTPGNNRAQDIDAQVMEVTRRTLGNHPASPDDHV
ncbi:hypothetical protein [Actinomadura sediminis]|uniref:Uncharacterized protein n=1 Tax=Actinomadura sediminis TaxID=1038904 RepID=A0ABW3F0K1_9ACTN